MKKNDNLSRRSFLVGGAAAAALGGFALAGCAPGKELSETGSKASSTDDIQWDYEADIIAVGAGAAGLSCGIRGAELGMSVIVLESQHNIGGSSALCNGGIAMPNTPLQREQGIEDSVELMASDLIEYSQSDNNPEWIEKHCQLAEGLWDWLTGMGLEFNKESLLPSMGASVPREHHIRPMEVISALQTAIEEAGSQVMVDTTATRLVQNSEGRVIGVMAEDSRGKQIAFKANRGVLLATNGFSRNAEMMNKYVFGTGAENVMTFAGMGDMGQGHLMAMAIGADTRHLRAISPLTTQHPEGTAGQGCAFYHNGAILVNAEGKRYVNEANGYAGVWTETVAQPDAICYQIWDNDIAVSNEDNDSSLYSMAKVRETGLLVSGDTLPELAAALGIPGDQLQSTVDKYNADIDASGVDSEFGRATLVSGIDAPVKIDTPPFYGWKTCNVLYGTIGGIKHNLDMQVEDVFGDVIPGLYVAGQICTYANFGIVPATIRNVSTSGAGFGGALIWGREVANVINEKEPAA